MFSTTAYLQQDGVVACGCAHRLPPLWGCEHISGIRRVDCLYLPRVRTAGSILGTGRGSLRPRFHFLLLPNSLTLAPLSHFVFPSPGTALRTARRIRGRSIVLDFLAAGPRRLIIFGVSQVAGFRPAPDCDSLPARCSLFCRRIDLEFWAEK